MGSLSNYTESKYLNHLTGKTAYATPTGLWIALSTTDPTETGSGITEPSGGNYARKATTKDDWTESTNGSSISNSTEQTFPEATAAWGTIQHFALYDHATTGNMLLYSNLTTPLTVGAAGQPRFPVGSLTISMD